MVRVLCILWTVCMLCVCVCVMHACICPVRMGVVYAMYVWCMYACMLANCMRGMRHAMRVCTLCVYESMNGCMYVRMCICMHDA